MKVFDVMTRMPVAVRADATLEEAAKTMIGARVSGAADRRRVWRVSMIERTQDRWRGTSAHYANSACAAAVTARARNNAAGAA